MSRLRAKCPECKTYTAVAIGPDYECHSCGRVFYSGLVRVPHAWGDGGEAMAESAWLEVPFPEAGIVEADTLEEQNLALAADLPERPLVLGGVGCTYVALDVDVLEPSEMSVFMPEPGGPSRAEIERILGDVAGRTKVLGAGFTGLTFEPSNIEPLTAFAAALGL